VRPVEIDERRRLPTPRRLWPWLLAALLWTSNPGGITAQGLTGTLIGTVTDGQGAIVVGALVQVSSPALIGGPERRTTDEKGQLRVPALPPGSYALEVALKGFTTYREQHIEIGAGATVDKPVHLVLAGITEAVVVESAGSRLEARHPGFGTRFNLDDLGGTPTRRAGMSDFLRATPGVSPTSPGSPTITTISTFGSGTNENQFLIDDTNSTCPCNGVARSEPVIDFVREIQVQSIGASAEYGGVQGAVINIVTRQGSDRFLYDAAYYWQTAGLTGQSVHLVYGAGDQRSGYERAKYYDLTTSLGGPAIRDRLWFFAGYERGRDYDSQPGTDPALPRTYEQDKTSAKLTWKLAPRWQLVQSLQYEYWVSPEQPTLAKPFGATQRRHASVPTIAFGNLTHIVSDRTLWEVRVGRFVHARVDDPNPGYDATPSHLDRLTNVFSGGPAQLGTLTLSRTSLKAMLTHYRSGLWGADHQIKAGVQFERGEGQGYSMIPTGKRFTERAGQAFQAISSDPSVTGGLSLTTSAFASDDLTLSNRLTITAGLRFDHARAISEDLHARDAGGHETAAIIPGAGPMYTWNIVSPRLGATLKLAADGRTILRGSYGRFSQGVLTGEFSSFHPGSAPITTAVFNPATGDYTRGKTVDAKSTLELDRSIRAPHTDEYSLGVDREIGSRLALAIAGVHKRGTDFIGWTAVGGHYAEEQRTLPDGRTLTVFPLVSSTDDLRFRLTNPDGYGMTYTGVVLAAEKRRSHGWQAFGSYTRSKTTGLQASSGSGVGSAQSSTVALPTVPIGRDPNDLTNARGRLLNDRPNVFRVAASVDVLRTGVVFAANLQHFSGKPWAATAQIALPQAATLPQGEQRILLEPPGARRLSSQTLLDLRVSRTVGVGGARVELLFDVLNALNDAAEEDLVTDNLFSPTFGQAKVFMDPRRAMLSVRLHVGR